VTVIGAGGVLAEGLVAGDGAVMREDPPWVMRFYDPDGTEVARITPKSSSERQMRL
jgi:hypothetical protein